MKKNFGGLNDHLIAVSIAEVGLRAGGGGQSIEIAENETSILTPTDLVLEARAYVHVV